MRERGAEKMIARIWRGRTRSGDAGAYSEYVQRENRESLNSTPGNLGTWLLRRLDGETAEFIVISLWDSMETVKNFSGPSTDKAVYYAEDERYLVEMDPFVRHYEVLSRPSEAGGRG
jgi:heme-degrading monooxygenase HmoA